MEFESMIVIGHIRLTLDQRKSIQRPYLLEEGNQYNLCLILIYHNIVSHMHLALQKLKIKKHIKIKTFPSPTNNEFN